MKSRESKGLVILIAAALSLSFPMASFSEDSKPGTARTIWNKVTGTVGGTIEGVGEVAGNLGDEISGSKSTKDARAEIDKQAAGGLEKLLRTSASARILNEKAYGYAVFDTRKFSFLLTTGRGAGVVVDKQAAARTYMNMFTGGAGIGIGMQFFQVVFFFEDKASLDRFVKHGWEANAAATAVFGEDSLEKNARFVEGMAVYQMNEAGIMADLNITGTKYWKSAKLNS